MIRVLPIVGVYLGELAVVRYDIDKLEKRINDLETEVKRLNNLDKGTTDKNDK